MERQKLRGAVGHWLDEFGGEWLLCADDLWDSLEDAKSEGDFLASAHGLLEDARDSCNYLLRQLGPLDKKEKDVRTSRSEVEG